MGVTLFYNADCPGCARQAKRTARLDWLSRVQISTDDSPIGPVPRGEIVVADDESERVFTGIYATRAVCMQVPAYLPYGLVLHIPPLRHPRRLHAGARLPRHYATARRCMQVPVPYLLRTGWCSTSRLRHHAPSAPQVTPPRSTSRLRHPRRLHAGARLPSVRAGAPHPATTPPAPSACRCPPTFRTGWCSTSRHYATRAVCMQVPAYLPYGLVLHIPPLRHPRRLHAGARLPSVRAGAPHPHYATRAVCMQVPAYLPYGLVLHIPPLRHPRRLHAGARLPSVRAGAPHPATTPPAPSACRCPPTFRTGWCSTSRHYATRAVCMQVPAYLPYGLVLHIPPLRHPRRLHAGARLPSVRAGAPHPATAADPRPRQAGLQW